MVLQTPTFAVARRAPPELRRTGLCVLISAAVAVAGGAILILARSLEVPIYEVLRDPAAQFPVPVHAGLLSYVGISILTLSVGILGFAAAFGGADRGRLALACAFAAMLALDDQYMLHERVLPNLLGLPENALYAGYAMVVLGLVAMTGPDIASLRHLPLLLAFAGFAASMVLDLILPFGTIATALEDLAKLGGYTMWLCYWTLCAARAFGRFAEE